MNKYPFMQVDAFTDRPLGGNPCAILFETDDLTSENMLAIAKEMNLSETSFVRQSDAANFGVRYFTPAEEIPLAGHPTIATSHALVESGRFMLTGERTVLTLELKVGPIEVEIFAGRDKVEKIVMKQKKPVFMAEHDPEKVAAAFGLEVGDFLVGYPIQTVSTGTPQLMVPLKDLGALSRAAVNVPVYTVLRGESDFFSPHLFVLGGLSGEGDTFARHFGIPPDTMEDPFTGSATGGMAAYLWRYGLIKEPKFTAEQGHWMERPGVAQVEVIGPREQIETVKVGGGAVTVLRGEFLIE
jgi:trans-2,3-dihydro-3-hydroxyanthranilate isomerase